jgi:hypothetical protein
MLGLFVENEQHSAIGWQFRSEHEPALALRWGSGDFGLNNVHTYGQTLGWQGRLRTVLCLNVQAEKKQQTQGKGVLKLI